MKQLTNLLIFTLSGTSLMANAYCQQPKPDSTNLALSDTTIQLEEVVVSTGLQRLPKERATGSFDHISSKQLQLQVSTDVMSRLEATANGYLFERRALNSRPIIRGIGSISGPTDPLVVLDNFPYEGDINQLNPNDIEDITILKDAAATSIWGARAANGVIVIRTKRGQQGTGFRANFSSNLTLASEPELGYIQQIAPKDFIEVEEMLYKEGYYNSRITDPNHPALTPAIELFIARETADEQERAAINAQLELLKQHDVRSDYKQYFYRPAFNQQYALNLQGNGQHMAWYAFAGYDHNESNLDNRYDRLSLRLQQLYRPLPGLEIDASVRYTHTGTQAGKPGYGSSGFPGALYPYARFADDDGTPLPLYLQYSRSFIAESNAAGQLLNWDFYPLLNLHGSRNTSKTADWLMDARVGYQLFNGLRAEVLYQFENQIGKGENLQSMNSYSTRHLINSYTSISPDGILSHPIPVGDIMDGTNDQLMAHQGRAQLNADYRWAKHELVALLGSELRHRRSRGQQHRLYGYNDDNLTFGAVDYSVPYRHYITGGNDFIPNGIELRDVTTRFVSLFANGAYTFDKRYTLSFSTRRDASNLFGVRTNDQWNIFWSAGGAWNISSEPFYRFNGLPYLKLRTTYGLSGNVDPAMVAVSTIQYMGTNAYLQTPYAQFANHYNPELRWESSRMINVGLDFRLAGDRLAGSIEYYHKKATDLFGRTLLDYTTGVGESITTNAGSMVGQGLDIQLNSRNRIGNVQWNIQLNYSQYRDRITENEPLSNRAASYLGSLSGSSGLYGQIGKPVNAHYAYRWAGLDPETGDPLGYVNGEVSKDYRRLTGSDAVVNELVYIGTAVPVYFGSFNHTLSYRRFSVDFSVLYKLGHYFRRPSINYYDLYRSPEGGHSDYALRWQEPGDELVTNVPSLVYPAVSARDRFYAGSEVLVEKGDHVRLQYVRLSYAFKNVQVFAFANNLGVLWKATRTNLDPEAIHAASTPANPSFSIGINASFSKN